MSQANTIIDLLTSIDPDRWLASGRDLGQMPARPGKSPQKERLIALALAWHPDPHGLCERLDRYYNEIARLVSDGKRVSQAIPENTLRRIWAGTRLTLSKSAVKDLIARTEEARKSGLLGEVLQPNGKALNNCTAPEVTRIADAIEAACGPSQLTRFYRRLADGIERAQVN